MNEQWVATQTRHKCLNNSMLMILHLKFHLDPTSTLLKTTLTKNFNLSRMDEWTDEWMDEWRLPTPIRHIILNNGMLMILCVKLN